ncbi:hypothetical protein BFP72_07365 [Reichenbachiella sp. 5M10]|uniref:hypothetical protein n=1 Tax=Reichenbachiella sp. 5M10 TaxID=1889772 RepID=UPI000C156BC5|nr:hypothetical protein [Reichenbachiella sp. 5M10]PIB35227.1 hypothetical protein BFP72_07365 [Reichenbachiella sp. 5M10]
MNKPAAIYFAIGILICKIISIALIPLVLYLLLYLKLDWSLLRAIGNAIFGYINLEDAYTKTPAYVMSYTATRFLFVVLRCGLMILCIHKKKRVGFWLFFVWELLMEISSIGFPVFGLVILFIMLRKSSRLYFKKEKEVPQEA